MRQLVLALFLLARLADKTSAQSPQSATRALEVAMRLANTGQIPEARAVLDSLMRAIAFDSPQLADALFIRATLAPSVLDANLDYEKIIREYPSSARREQSLLRVAQRSLAAGENGKALEFLRTMSREYRADSSRAIASYWTARVLLEQHDVTAACAANRDAMSHATAAGSALRADVAAQSAASCAPAAVSVAVNAATRTIYAVQVSAYATRLDAEAMSQRLKKAGLDAHVDGNAKPFRVRVGHYHTYAEAAAALRDLKTRNLSGFVAEMGP